MSPPSSAIDLNKIQRSLSPHGSDGSPKSGKPGKIPTRAMFKKKTPNLWAESVLKGGGAFVHKKKSEDPREEDRATHIHTTANPSTKDSPFSPAKTNLQLGSPVSRPLGSQDNTASTKRSDDDLKIVLDPAKDQAIIQQLQFQPTVASAALDKSPVSSDALPADLGAEFRAGAPQNPKSFNPAPPNSSSTLAFGQRVSEPSFGATLANQLADGSDKEAPKPAGFSLFSSNGAGSLNPQHKPQPQTSSQIESAKQQRKPAEFSHSNFFHGPKNARPQSPVLTKEEVAKICSALPQGLLDLESLVLVKPAYYRLVPEVLPATDAAPPLAGPVSSQWAPRQPLDLSDLKKRGDHFEQRPIVNPLSSLESGLSVRSRATAAVARGRESKVDCAVFRRQPTQQVLLKENLASWKQSPVRNRPAVPVSVRLNYNNQLALKLTIPSTFMSEAGSVGVFLQNFCAVYLGGAVDPADTVLTYNLKRLQWTAGLGTEQAESAAAIEVYVLGTRLEDHCLKPGLHSLPPADLLEQLLRSHGLLTILGFTVGNRENFVRWDKRVKLAHGFALDKLVEELSDGNVVLTDSAWKNQVQFLQGDCKKVSSGKWLSLIQIDRLFS